MISDLNTVATPDPKFLVILLISKERKIARIAVANCLLLTTRPKPFLFCPEEGFAAKIASHRELKEHCSL